ncbi:hypothetical protein SCHPADRAFT_945921 [Schizopora paradoxa]|uniref:Uncharacterized protein n=1 Tax=Schizopora paradoxa TaxID=27342 RepID=A0A0H2RPA6_9AGAM|nr:hypothetical protein SCHPADRAFT_945921 [Schizopora paradoxa]
MQYFVYMALGASLTLFPSFANGQSASNASLSLITNDDPAISYAPEYCQGSMTACFGSWWDTILPNGTGFKTTGGPFSTFKSAVTSLTFPFKGTSVEVHGLMDTQGALVFLQLDDQLVALNTSTGLHGQSLVPTLLHTFDNLDANTTHTLTFEWAGTGSTQGDGLLSLAYLDHLVVGNYLAVVNPNTLTPSTQDTTQNSPSQTVFSSPSSLSTSPAAVSLSSSSKGMSKGATAGLVIAILFIIALVSTVIFYNIRLRRRPLAPSEQFRIFVQSRQERRVEIDEPSSPSSFDLKARPHMSLPPPIYEYFSKGDSSYLDLESQSSRTNSEESLPGQVALDKQFLDLGDSPRGSAEDKRKTAVSALSIPASAYYKDSDAQSVMMCTLSRPRIAKGAIVGSPDHEFEYVYDDARADLPELPDASTSRCSTKKRSRQGLGTRLSNTMRRSMKRGAVPPVPPLPPPPPEADRLAVASSSRSIMSRKSCPPPYAIE